jgi:hypothetical protein
MVAPVKTEGSISLLFRLIRFSLAPDLLDTWAAMDLMERMYCSTERLLLLRVFMRLCSLEAFREFNKGTMHTAATTKPVIRMPAADTPTMVLWIFSGETL